MSRASEVEVEEVALDSDGGLMVKPRLPPGDDLAFICYDTSWFDHAAL
jgi:hypothetical protein